MSLRWIVLTVILVAATGTILSSLLRAQVQRIPVTVDEAAQADSQATSLFMQAKLGHAHKILEGLVTQDFAAIERGAAAMSKISLTPPPDLRQAGDQSDAEVYEHFRLEFARLSGQLERHARRKELEATAYVQQNLTATCIACHDYIRDDP